MKKKLLILSAVLFVGILGMGFYNVLASSSGYDAYKEALIETHKMKSGVANIEFSVSNNGELLQEVTVKKAYNLEENRNTATINLNTPDQNLQLTMNKEEKQVYIENNETDTTYVIETNHDPDKMKEKHERFHNKELLKIAELVVDTLTQPLHDSFVMGPDNSISVNISNDDIPTAIHALGSYMVKKGFGAHSNIEMTKSDYPFLTSNYKQQLPALKDEIIFDAIDVIAQLDENGMLKKQEASFQITGKDESGASHSVTIQFNINFENINATSISPFSLDGKTLETVELKKVHKFH